MKMKIYLLLAIAALAYACVDDYTESNPSYRLDAPAVRINSSDANQTVVTVPANQYQNNYQAFVKYGTPVTYTVSVVDAPGKAGAVTVTPSVPEFGSVTIDEASVAALQGQESGEFRFTFTPNPDLTPDEERSLNVVVTVSDTQLNKDGEAAPKTTTLTIPLTLVGGPCFSSGIAAGSYRVISASGNLDGGDTFTLDTLKKYYGTANVLVNIEQVHPGLYTIDEVTGGVWPLFYSGRANPALDVDLCDNVISGHEGSVSTGVGTAAQRNFTLNGTLNADGTITMTWSYEREDGNTPPDPAQGTYTLEPF
jgi:hypothetical protein